MSYEPKKTLKERETEKVAPSEIPQPPISPYLPPSNPDPANSAYGSQRPAPGMYNYPPAGDLYGSRSSRRISNTSLEIAGASILTLVTTIVGAGVGSTSFVGPAASGALAGGGVWGG